MSTIDENAYEHWLKVVYDRISVNFSRAEPRRRAWTYLADLPNAHASGLRGGDGLANYSGEQRADGVQRLLTSAQWNESVVRDELRGIAAHYGGGTGGVLHLTEVSFPKKGRNAVGVERQYSPESMRSENCQIGLLLFHVTKRGRAFLIDRELYVPKSWTDDTDRRAQAGIPDELAYRSKSAIGGVMIRRAFEAGILPDCVVSSLVCSDQPSLRRWLRHLHVPHVVATTAGEARQAASRTPLLAKQESCAYKRGVLRRVKLVGEMAGGFEKSYLTASPTVHGSGPQPYFASFLRQRTPLAEIAAILSLTQPAAAYGRRAKEEIGLGHYEVRSWRGWYRHVTLAMAAHTALELAREPNPVRQIA
jgi:hypothetical protein